MHRCTSAVCNIINLYTSVKREQNTPRRMRIRRFLALAGVQVVGGDCAGSNIYSPPSGDVGITEHQPCCRDWEKKNPGCRCKRGEIDLKAAKIGIKIFLSAREFLVAAWKTSPFIHEMRVSARTSFSSTCAGVTSNCSSLPKRDSAYVYKYVYAPESLYPCALICMYSCLNSSYLYIFMS